jgi:hypothetical protein
MATGQGPARARGSRSARELGIAEDTKREHTRERFVQIKIDAPRQLSLETILDEVRTEYRRAIDTVPSYPTREAHAVVGRVSESTEVYAPAPPAAPDLVIAELDRAASKGASTREIEQATGVSTHRVRKRLKELLDAGLIEKSGNRYFKQGADTEPSPVPKQKAAPRSKKSTVETTQALFSEMDLQAHRTRP